MLTVNLAVVFFGLAGVLGKLSGLPSPLIVLGRVVFAGCALAVLAMLRGLSLAPRNRRDIVVLLSQGVLLALHWTAFFQAINVSTVAIGLLAFSSFPLFTAAIEPLLLRQRASLVQVIAAGTVLPGIYLLVPSLSLSNRSTIGVLWGLLAGLTFALLSVTNRWLGRRYRSAVISLYQDATAAVVLLPTLFLLQPRALITPRALLILLVLGVLCTAVAHTLFIEGMRSMTAQLASLFASLEPVWGIAFALFMLGEVPSARTLLGGAIILTATATPVVVALGTQGRAPRPARAVVVSGQPDPHDPQGSA